MQTKSELIHYVMQSLARSQLLAGALTEVLPHELEKYLRAQKLCLKAAAPSDRGTKQQTCKTKACLSTMQPAGSNHITNQVPTSRVGSDIANLHKQAVCFSLLANCRNDELLSSLLALMHTSQTRFKTKLIPNSNPPSGGGT